MCSADRPTPASDQLNTDHPDTDHPDTKETDSKADMPAAAQVLVDFTPTKDFFAGIDSDGCAMDAMDIKHYECFTPSYIKYWDLQPISTLARETALFVNLHSITRGLNRWLALRQRRERHDRRHGARLRPVPRRA